MSKYDPTNPNIEIPSKLFRGDFTWTCYEYSRSWAICIQLLITIAGIIGLFTIGISKYGGWWVAILFITLYSTCISLPLYMLYTDLMRKRYVSKNLETVADAVETVFDAESGIGAENWVEVAKIINEAFHSEGVWKTPYFFFNGLSCELAFRRSVLKNYPMYGETKDLKELDVSGDDKIRSAVYSYEQAIRGQFDIWAAEASKIPDTYEKVLPRDQYKRKTLWRIKRTVLLDKFCLAVGIIWCFYVFKWLGGLVYCLFTIILKFFNFRACELTISNQNMTTYWVRYLAIIKGVAPGTNTERWDLVAKLANAKLCGDTNNTLKDCFYDGADCLKFFQKKAKPLGNGKVKKNSLPSNELMPLLPEVLDVCV